MGVYIKDMEMPKERESFTLTIKYNGLVVDTETGIQVAEAQEVPPHGRLIDADALIPMMKYATTDSEIGIFPIKIGFNDIVKVINDQSTIIEAEGENNEL